MAQKPLRLGNVHDCGCLQKYCDNLLQVIKVCLKDILAGYVAQVYLFYLSSVSQRSVSVVTGSHSSLSFRLVWILGIPMVTWNLKIKPLLKVMNFRTNYFGDVYFVPLHSLNWLLGIWKWKYSPKLLCDPELLYLN